MRGTTSLTILYISMVHDLGFGRLSMGDWGIRIDSIGKDTASDLNNKCSPQQNDIYL